MSDMQDPLERAYYAMLDAAVAMGKAERAYEQALAEETYEYQIQTRSQRMPTWLAITDDTLQKWYSEDKYKNLIRSKQGSGWVEVRVLRRRVSPPEVIDE